MINVIERTKQTRSVITCQIMNIPQSINSINSSFLGTKQNSVKSQSANKKNVDISNLGELIVKMFESRGVELVIL